MLNFPLLKKGFLSKLCLGEHFIKGGFQPWAKAVQNKKANRVLNKKHPDQQINQMDTIK
jgi:hypothetical protein